MVFKRVGGKSHYFKAITRTGGYDSVSTGAPLTRDGKILANKMAAMWQALAVEHRAWDLLDPILAKKRRERVKHLGKLYDAWVQTKYNITETRHRMDDPDLAPIVTEWHKVYARGVSAGQADKALAHVRSLIPPGMPLLRSAVTTTWLTTALAAYPAASRNTLRRVHSHWSQFFGYLADVRHLFAANPMASVSRPSEHRIPVEFYELDVVERIIGAQPSPERQALFTLLYGTGIEVSTALRLTRADIDAMGEEMRAAGTKAHKRDRVAMVSEWAWPRLAAYIKPLFPAARLFPATWKVDAVSRWHHYTCEVWLELPKVLRLHCARHHWAILALRAGVPVAVVQRQLGHSTAKLTLDTYGAFIPTGEDRAYWKKRVTESEARRKGPNSSDRGANSGAKTGTTE